MPPDPKLAHPFLAASSDWDVDLFRLIFRARLEIGAMDESVYAAESEGRMNGVMYLLPPGITFGES